MSQSNQVSNQETSQSNQEPLNLVTRKLTKKEEDIRNFCSVPVSVQK